MSRNTHDRRKASKLAVTVDEGIELAHVRGWRYALAYLISERVPPEIIQRLMFDGRCARRDAAP